MDLHWNDYHIMTFSFLWFGYFYHGFWNSIYCFQKYLYILSVICCKILRLLNMMCLMYMRHYPIIELLGWFFPHCGLMQCYILHLYFSHSIHASYSLILFLSWNTDDFSWTKRCWCVLWFILQELLEDPAIISAIDEETEFNALVVCMLPLVVYIIFLQVFNRI